MPPLASLFLALASCGQDPQAGDVAVHAELLRSSREAIVAARDALKKNDRARALELVRQTSEALLADTTPDLDAAELLLGAGNIAWGLGDLRRTRACWERTCADRERLLGGDHAAVQSMRMNLAVAEKELGNLARARELEERVLAVRERLLAPEHPDVQSIRLNLANTLQRQGELVRARAMFEQVLEVRERTLPETHPDLQLVRQDLGQVLTNAGELERARTLFEKVVAARAATLEPGDPQLAGARTNLALVLRTQGHAAEARRLFESVLATLEARLPADHPQLAQARANLASVLLETGAPERARELATQSVEVLARSCPPDHPALINARFVLAKSLFLSGDIPAARALYEQALESCEKSLLAGQPDVRAARLGLAVTLHAQGDYRAARALEQRIVDELAGRLPAGHPERLLAQGNLAATLLELDAVHEARVLLEGTLHELESSGSASASDLRRVRLNLASALKQDGDLAGARALEERVLADCKELREEDPERLRAELSLGITLRAAGELQQALASFEHVAAVRERCLPAGHVETLSALENLAWTRALAGEAEASLAAEARLVAQSLAACAEVRGASPRERVERAAFLLDVVSTVLSLPAGPPATEARRVQLLLAARELHLSAPLDAAVRSRPEARAILDELRALRGRIHDLASQPGTQAGAESSADLAELVRARDRSEAQLLAALPEVAADFAPEPAAIAQRLGGERLGVVFHVYLRRTDVQQALRPGARGEARLAAWILRDDRAPERIELGALDALQSAVARWRAAIGAPLSGAGSGTDRGLPLVTGSAPRAPAAEERAATTALRELVLDPLFARAGAAQELVLSLDGPLHLVALDALLVDAPAAARPRPRIVLATSLARAARPAAPAQGEAQALLVGGVDFGAAPESGAAASAVWPPLPATEREVAALGALSESALGRKARVLSAAGATKAALEREAPGARFVHLATHGWFAPADVSATAALDLAPWTLCGIALAGANRGRDAAGRLPGLLSAEELGGFDLSACELAVLSACETNVGIARAGQGIQSLQAALHAAGARTAITSLWRVDDEATRELFEDFYARVWVRKQGKSAALWAAKMALRDKGHPTRDWAGWVLSGAAD